MMEFFVAILILLGLYLAFKIIHHLIQVFKCSSSLLFVIVLILLVAGKKELQLPFQTNEIKPMVLKSLEDIDIMFWEI